MSDDKHFGRPTDIAWLPDGTFFISDGYVNTRVVKFDKNGKFLMTWGTKGNGPGQFDLPHSIDIDAQRRVYVADRSNSRIQIFDENGKYLNEWDNIRPPYHIMMTTGTQRQPNLWVADGVTNKFLKYDLNGKLLYSWGTYGSFPGAFWGVHQFSVDSDGQSLRRRDLRRTNTKVHAEARRRSRNADRPAGEDHASFIAVSSKKIRQRRLSAGEHDFFLLPWRSPPSRPGHAQARRRSRNADRPAGEDHASLIAVTAKT